MKSFITILITIYLIVFCEANINCVKQSDCSDSDCCVEVDKVSSCYSSGSEFCTLLEVIFI